MTSISVVIVLYEGVQSLDVTGPLEVFTGAGPPWDSRTCTASRPPGPAAGRYARPAGSGCCPTTTCVTSDRRTRSWCLAGRARSIPIRRWCAGSASWRPEPNVWWRCALALSCSPRPGCWPDGAPLRTGRTATPSPGATPTSTSIPNRSTLDGNIASSTGVTAGIDLALALVEEDLGRDAALQVARHLVVFLRRPGGQAQFSTQLTAQLAERHPLRDVQCWIAEHPDGDLSTALQHGFRRHRLCRPRRSPARRRPCRWPGLTQARRCFSWIG